MDNRQVAAIFGGCSSEYKVSLKSAYSIVEELENKCKLLKIGISQNGKWYLYSGDNLNILEDTWLDDFENLHELEISLVNKCFKVDNKKLNIDVAFVILHGRNGEDGTVQGLLELLEIRYTGCGVLSSALCMDKYRAHLIVNKHGIKSAQAVYLTRHSNLVMDELKETITFPVFVKPVNSGSSIGITRVDNEQKLGKAIEYAFNFDNEVVIEQGIIGYEVGCAMVGSDNIIIGTVDKVELNTNFFSYNEKYSQENSEIKTLSAEKALIEEIEKCAKTIYRALNCKGFARIDLFICNNEIYFNEVNTIPGFTTQSRFPKMMENAGISFERLVEMIIEDAIK